MPLLSVVVPTYREADHIQELLQAIANACEGKDYEIIVVDDNSPDGTHAKVVEEQARNPRIVPVLRVHEKGLATAVIEGMRRARGEYVVVMDSDFQHPPATVPELFEAAQRTNADVVVASRYVAGGAVTGFPFHRRVISWGAKMLAVVALPPVRHFHITDPMSGFFLVRKAAIDVESLNPIGYKILVEVLARGRIQRASEVGFRFDVRRGGESKLRLSTQRDYFRHVLRLAFKDRENQRAMMFLLVGLTGVIVNIWVHELVKRTFDVPETVPLILIPASIAREVSIVWNFTFNELVTFRDLREKAHAGFFHRVLRFNIVSIFAWVAYLGIFTALVYVHIDDVVALLLAIALTFVVNYRGNRRWTYAAKPESTNA
jgi:dolichol-phosphate mannosyltransferase